MIIAFTLTMPGVASWDGKWSGEANLYAITRTIRKQDDPEKILEKERYSFSWPDGWRASVKAERVDSRTAAKIRKKSSGFCGYDWMVDSIIKNGEIKDS